MLPEIVQDAIKYMRFLAQWAHRRVHLESTLIQRQDFESLLNHCHFNRVIRVLTNINIIYMNLRKLVKHFFISTSSKTNFNWLSLLMSMIASFCAVLFPHEMSWMRSWTLLSQFLRVFLPTLAYQSCYVCTVWRS